MISTETFNPTLLQKLLGRNYKWWYIVKYNFTASLAYRTTALFIILRDLAPMFISLAIYGSFSEQNNYLLYILLANIFFKLVLLFGDIAWEISGNIRYGGLSTKLLNPTSWLKYEFFAVLGGNFYTFLVNLGILSFLIYTNDLEVIFDQNLLLALTIVLLIGSFLYFIIDLLFGLVTFWTVETNTLIELKSVITPFLTGSLVIFDFNPNLEVLKYLPWSFISYHPMQIYLGEYDNVQTGWTLLGGITWCVMLYFLAKIIFRLGLKRNESIGL